MSSHSKINSSTLDTLVVNIPHLHPSAKVLADAVESLLLHPVLALFGVILLYTVGKILYNLYLHPLSRFPGPRIAAATDLWYGYIGVTGDQYKILQALHAQYGPILRISPHELSFATATALNQIYARPTGKRKPFPKSVFWKAIAMGFTSPGVATELDIDEHKRKRTYLQPMVSIREARKNYEGIIMENVNRFINALKERAGGEEGIDFVELLHCVMFDLTGDLVFGEPFGSVEKGEPHEWFSLILDNVDLASYTQFLERIPALNWFVLKVLPKHLAEARTYHVRETTKKVLHRLHTPHPDKTRTDIMTHLLNVHRKSGGKVTIDEVAAQATNLIIGGSETVATACTFTIYHVLNHPHIHANIVRELRSSPNGTISAWLDAAVKEAFRLHSPAPTGFPRVSLGEEVDGEFIPKGTGVFVHPWTVLRSSEYWKYPNEFHPERWLSEAGEASEEGKAKEFKDDTKAAFAPFGMGSRQCLAADLAWDELRKILGALFRNFEMELVDKEEDWESKNRAYLLWKKAPLRIRAVPVAGVE